MLALAKLSNDTVANNTSTTTLTRHRAFNYSPVLREHLRSCAGDFLVQQQQQQTSTSAVGGDQAIPPLSLSLSLQRLHSRYESADKAELSVRQRHRASFRQPEDYLATLRAHAAVSVGRGSGGGGGGGGVGGGGGGGGDWSSGSLEEAAARMELNPRWA